MAKLLPVEGYEDYMVSSCGQVISLKAKEMKILAGGLNHMGYRQVALFKDGVEKKVMVHRLVAETFLPHPDSDRLTVDHIDRDKTNNSASNLRWMTIEENRRRESSKLLPMGVAETSCGTYFARRSIGGIYYYSSPFPTPEEAGEWYESLPSMDLKKVKSCVIGKKKKTATVD